MLIQNVPELNEAELQQTVLNEKNQIEKPSEKKEKIRKDDGQAPESFDQKFKNSIKDKTPSTKSVKTRIKLDFKIKKIKIRSIKDV